MITPYKPCFHGLSTIFWYLAVFRTHRSACKDICEGCLTVKKTPILQHI
uniref:Uncharacterized protein n=1 Tax=Anguilla anguilla TaxID=7936 RepID=A0A0E9SJT6_ANGAN